MNKARCTADGLIYSALEFARLLSTDLELKRRFLQCPACGGPGFFRHASPIGRAACFGARPHAQDCQLAAQECADEERGAKHIPGSRIVVDFGYGSPARPEFVEGFSHAPNSDRVSHHLGDGYRPHVHVYRRRLSSLLRSLVDSPAFSNSDLNIEIDGHGEMAARDFFVPLQFATYQYSGIYRGYFGVISDAKLALDKSLWLNSGGNDNISFCIDSKYVSAISQRYGVSDLEDFAGAYILVIGTLRVSPDGKIYCVIQEPDFMALRLT